MPATVDRPTPASAASANVPAATRRLLPLLRQRVHARLGRALRARASVDDYVHDVVLELLADPARMQLAVTAPPLLTRIVDNTLRSHHTFWNRQRRSVRREVHGFDADTVAAPPSVQDDAVSRVLHTERTVELERGLSSLPAPERELIRWRDLEQAPFDDIARRLCCTAKAARMRHLRALARLAGRVRRSLAG